MYTICILLRNSFKWVVLKIYRVLMKIRINKQNVDDLDFAEKGQIIYRDTDLIGFIV